MSVVYFNIKHKKHTHTPTTVLRSFFRDYPGEPVPEENFWTLWCKARLTEADTPTIQLGATPSGLTSAHLHHPPIFFTGQMPFLPPNQQCQSTEGSRRTFSTYKTCVTFLRMFSSRTSGGRNQRGPANADLPGKWASCGSQGC